MKKILLACVVSLCGFITYAQQDVQMTHYMFDRLSFNPAATGLNRGYCGTFMYRHQWAGVAGAPSTVLVNGETQLTNISSGVGFSFIHDQIGFYKNNFLKLNYSYQHVFHGIGRASVGLGLGMINVGLSPNWITPDISPDLDPSLAPSLDGISKINFDMNFGLYFQGDQGYFAGISAGHLTSPSFVNSGIFFTSVLHYYIYGGMDLDNSLIASLPSKLKLTPTILLKGEPASIQFDLNLRALWNDKIYGGFSYRVQDAVAVMVGYQQKIAETPAASQHIRIGYAYDVTTSALNQYSNGSHEFMVNYCYVPKVIMPRERAVNPRFL